MKRRAFILALGGAAAAWPLAAWAQQGEGMRRVGVLIGVADDAEGRARLEAFQKGLQDLGWREGQNVRLDIRFSGGTADRARALAADLVGLAPHVILANTAAVVAALQQQTRTIPIVFAQVVDPVSSGFVANLSHPGGNITGFISFDFSMGAKWLEILKDISPGMARVGVLRDPSIPGGSGLLGAIQAVAPTFRVELNAIDIRDAAAIEHGIENFARVPKGALIVLPNPMATVHLKLITGLASRHRLPAIYPYRYFATNGGLVSYGVDNLDLWRRAAAYVDRILKGQNTPAELPVQLPTKFELVINLKAAKTLGLTMPENLLARADEVIE